MCNQASFFFLSITRSIILDNRERASARVLIWSDHLAYRARKLLDGGDIVVTDVLLFVFVYAR